MSRHYDIGALLRILRAAWTADTSASPGMWTPSYPSIGQCAVSALIFQDYLGGRLLRSVVNGKSHYFNKLDDEWWDLTFDQFSPPYVLTDVGKIRTRSYVLSDPSTRSRYKHLLYRVQNQ
jgi:hypothetical protein